MNAVAWGVLLCLWGVVGAGVGAALASRGQPPLTVVSALLIWPLLAPVLLADAAVEGRIQTAFARLEGALRQAGEPVPQDLAPLCASLLASERRLGEVDRLLAEEADAPDVEALRAARDRAAREIDAVLAEVARVRVQLGLAALAGDAGLARDRIAALLARARALEEMRAILHPHDG